MIHPIGLISVFIFDAFNIPMLCQNSQQIFLNIYCMSTVPFSFGYKQDLPDERDYKYQTTFTGPLPESVDLISGCMPIRNQGKLGACTAFATGAMVEYVRKKQKLKEWSVSTLFTYYATRLIEGTVDSDSGAYVRDALKSAVNYGVTNEDIWPYDISVFTTNPPQSAWQDALNHQALVYYRLEQTKENILNCLAEGYPFTFGMMLYESFIQTQCGFLVYNELPMPDLTKEKFIGGHCMMAVGYYTSNGTTYIKVRNSWSTYVGLNGYHNIPIDYFLNPSLASDFWTIRSEEYTVEELITPPEPEPVIPPTPVPPTPPTPPEPPKPNPVIPPDPAPIVEDKKEKIIRWIILAFFIIMVLVFIFVK